MAFISELRARFPNEPIAMVCHRLVSEHFPTVYNSHGSTDVFALARTAGIEMEFSEANDYEGMFSWDESGHETITLSSQENRLRRRFTVAHEIGHCLIRRLFPGQTQGSRLRSRNKADGQCRDEEYLANLFAAEILIPLNKLAEILTLEQRATHKLVRRISNQFEVSRMVVLRRWAQAAGSTVLFLNLVPNRFRNLASYAIVDDALYIVPDRGLVFDRDCTRLLRRIPFSEITKGRSIRIGIRGLLGRTFAEFDVQGHDRPIPNVDLIAAGMTFRTV